MAFPVLRSHLMAVCSSACPGSAWVAPSTLPTSYGCRGLSLGPDPVALALYTCRLGLYLPLLLSTLLPFMQILSCQKAPWGEGFGVCLTQRGAQVGALLSDAAVLSPCPSQGPSLSREKQGSWEGLVFIFAGWPGNSLCQGFTNSF